MDAVSKSFVTRSGTRLEAIHEASFSVAPGQFVSLLGPSGCGKSTLLKIIAGLMPASSGEVRAYGKRVDQPVTDLGYVFQEDVLLPWRNVLENVLLQIQVRRLPVKNYVDRARELLALAGLEGFEHVSPYTLSGGMKQRVSVCRALVHDPHLLLMDEPFGALDAMTRDQLALDLQQICGQEKPVVFVTHSIEEAVFLSDTVLIMSQRPSRIADAISIPLPRPRRLLHRESEDFLHLTNQVRQVFQKMGILRESSLRR